MSTYITVIGRLTKNPEQHKVGEQEITKVTFRIAANESRRDPVTQQWTEGEKYYVNVNCWRVLGRNALVLGKGDPVIVHGRLRTREWSTADGERRSVTELDAMSLGPDLSKCAVTELQRLRSEPPPTAAASPAGHPAAVSDPATFSGAITESLTDGDQRVPGAA